jgi:hypothetical protein
LEPEKGTLGTGTFCFSGTGLHSGSGSESDIKMTKVKKVKNQNEIQKERLCTYIKKLFENQCLPDPDLVPEPE